MIVVEGPDGAGKTTLINHLVQETGLSVAPRVVSKDAEAMVDLKVWVEQNVAAGFQRVIYDRHRLISEPIYGPALRPQLEQGFDDIQWFYTQMSRFYDCNPVLIYCLPPFEVVWENVMSDPENARFHGDGKAVQQIYAAYLNKITTDQVLYNRAWAYDYTDSIAPTMLNLITGAVRRAVS